MTFEHNLCVNNNQYHIQLFEDSFVVWQKNNVGFEDNDKGQRMNCADGVWWTRIAHICKNDLPKLFNNLLNKTKLSKTLELELLLLDRGLLLIVKEYLK